MAATFPTLYLSHGSPMIALEPSPAASFLERLGPALDAAFGRPRAVVVVSPHTATRKPVTLGGARHEAIYDFGGFPEALYRLRYDAPGHPQVAAEVAARIERAGIDAEAVDATGLDHGIWTLMRRMWPAADLPVVPLSLVPMWSPAQQWAIGEALAPLADDGVLIIGSGAFTHNLRRFFGGARQGVSGTDEAPDVAEFRAWVAERAAARDWDALRDYRRRAPHAVQQHPTDEHWLPFYVAAAAGGNDAVPLHIHGSVDHGVLAMDGYAFGAAAPRLHEALATH